MALQDIVQALLPQVEVLVKTAIEAKSDEVVEQVLAEIKKAIPTQIDDVIIEQLKPTVKAEIKKFLLAQAEKIS